MRFQMNDDNQGRITQAMEVAVAGVVLSVVLAVVALALAAAYVAKLKRVDVKYSQWVTMGKFSVASAHEEGL
jgi:TctA family transporter